MLFSYYMNHTNVQEERALKQSSGIQADRTSTILNLHYLEQGAFSVFARKEESSQRTHTTMSSISPTKTHVTSGYSIQA